MTFKDDPLQQQRRSPRTLWLGKENMVEARDNFWRAYEELNPLTVRTLDDKHTWDVAWAAAIAAFSYVMEGRVEP